MAVKGAELEAVFSTTSYRSPQNGGNKPHSSPMSAFERLRRKLSPKKAAGDDLKQSISSGCTSSSDDENGGEVSTACQWNETEMVFKYFDENGDGKISQEELRRCVEAVGGEMSEEEAEMAVRTSDADGDGMLGLEDFTKLIEGGGEEERKDVLKAAFKMYAVENGDYITPKSLRKMMERLGNSCTIENCRRMVSNFDINGDGVLSFEEFRVMMR